MKKEFENIFKIINYEERDFSLHKKELNKTINQLLLIS